jgi:hypothetical protein
MIKRYLFPIFLFASLLITGCADTSKHARAVYMLLDTSGTYQDELNRAKAIMYYLLGTLTSGDSLFLARIDSASFSEKDIIAKMTFDRRPSYANGQKRLFRQKVDQFITKVKGSAYTDITGGMLQAVEQLNELGAGRKTILLFSDLKEEVIEGHVRDISIDFTGCRVVAINVIKLRSDNIDPREYYGRVEKWRERVESGGGKWRVVNDLDRLDVILED